MGYYTEHLDVFTARDDEV